MVNPLRPTRVPRREGVCYNKSVGQSRECIAVVGLGRFGAVWAELLIKHAKEGGYEVIAYNRSARKNALIPVVPLSEIARATIIFICTSISSLPEVLRMLSPLVGAHTIVCDTCSVKEYPQECMQSMLPKTCALLGTHPMFGPDSLRQSTNLPIVFSPIRISKEQLRRCTDLFSLWHLHSIPMTAQRHDQLSAYSQGFTHIIGRIVQEMKLAPTDIATLGYEKLLQVMEQTCRDKRELFLDLERYNHYTKEMLVRFRDAVETICTEIENNQP